ncbi:MAG: excinuclease ABC subunit UvrC [Pseudomonadota bacterium]
MSDDTQDSGQALGFDLDEFLLNLTSKPGVYRMLDRRGKIIYVGKAKNLRKRVTSYFRKGHIDPKTRSLVSHIARVEVTVTHTETEALILENNLIKEYRPRFNIVLRDDKSYPYIHVTTDQEFPRLAFHRGTRRKTGRYFGPYPSAAATRQTLNLLQKLFLVRQCPDSFFRNRSRPCLQHQIKRCTAPCVGLVDEAAYSEDVRHALMFLEGKSEEMVSELVGRMENASQNLDFEFAARYRDQITALRRVQERQYVSGAKGNIDVIVARYEEGVGVVEVFLIRDGQNLGNRTFFPKNTLGATAGEVLEAFVPQYYLSGPKERLAASEVVLNAPLRQSDVLAEVLSARAEHRVRIGQGQRGERARWVSMAETNADIALKQHLTAKETQGGRVLALQEALDLETPPERIECFDISHTQGEATVASCVVFGLEGAVKGEYRRFNIRDVQAGDDYAAMEQALRRRYSRLKKEEAKLPELVLIDGGKGQVAKAVAVMQELDLPEVRLVGVAKGPTRRAGLESLILPERSAPMVLPEESPALHLIHQIRDEAHRFAITGHRSKRQKTRRESTLESIAGIGPTLRRRLLTEFGGLRGVSRAGIEDLARVKGISRELARTVYDALRDG